MDNQIVGLGGIFSGDFFCESLMDEISSVNIVDKFAGGFDCLYIKFGIELVGEVEGPINVAVSSTEPASLGDDTGSSGVYEVCCTYAKGIDTSIFFKVGEFDHFKVGVVFPLPSGKKGDGIGIAVPASYELRTSAFAFMVTDVRNTMKPVSLSTRMSESRILTNDLLGFAMVNS